MQSDPITPQIVEKPELMQEITASGIVATSSPDAQRLEVLRVMLLLAAADVAPQGITVSAYHLRVRVHGLDANVSDIARELQYLLDKGLIADVPKILSPENHLYRITANGRDFLGEHRYAD